MVTMCLCMSFGGIGTPYKKSKTIWLALRVTNQFRYVFRHSQISLLFIAWDPAAVLS